MAGKYVIAGCGGCCQDNPDVDCCGTPRCNDGTARQWLKVTVTGPIPPQAPFTCDDCSVYEGDYMCECLTPNTIGGASCAWCAQDAVGQCNGGLIDVSVTYDITGRGVQIRDTSAGSTNCVGAIITGLSDPSSPGNFPLDCSAAWSLGPSNSAGGTRGCNFRQMTIDVVAP